MLRDALIANHQRAIIVHYADLLKYMCRTFFDWNGEKDDEGRTLLQRIGTDVVREQNPNFWCDFIISVLKMFPDEWDYVIIADCRFPNEIESMRESNFDTTHVRVHRPNFDSSLSAEQLSHASEIALDEYPVDHFVINGGTLCDLRSRVAELVKEVFH